jgi:hypothetical protein
MTVVSEAPWLQLHHTRNNTSKTRGPAQLPGRSEFARKPTNRIGPERGDGSGERLNIAAGRALEREFYIADRASRIPAYPHRMLTLAA